MFIAYSEFKTRRNSTARVWVCQDAGHTCLPAGRCRACPERIHGLTFLAGCAIGGNPAVLFADPAKYQFSSCEQLAKHRKELSTREQELRQLMDRAEQGTGGALVNVLAYKGDYIAATEELSLIDSTATSKKCDTPANWPSNSAVR